jgi:hypothetical protein
MCCQAKILIALTVRSRMVYSSKGMSDLATKSGVGYGFAQGD